VSDAPSPMRPPWGSQQPRRAAPLNATSLTRRLDNLAVELGLPPRRVRRLVAVAVVGQLLGVTGAGIVKGATSLEVRLGTSRTRVSSDLDTVRRGTLDEFREHLDRALRVGWHGFGGRLKDLGPIPTPAPLSYRPHRFRLKVEYRGGDVTSVDLEVSPEEIDAFESDEQVESWEARTWFAIVGLPQPRPIPVLGIDHQISQKLHATTLPDTRTWINDRVHDLVDLQLALNGSTQVSSRALHQTVRRLFAARGTHPWPPVVTPRAGWESGYLQQAEGLDVLRELDDAIAWANDLVDAIARA
jgi:hypothetical protein